MRKDLSLPPDPLKTPGETGPPHSRTRANRFGLSGYFAVPAHKVGFSLSVEVVVKEEFGPLKKIP
jgi:hypothetical protein